MNAFRDWLQQEVDERGWTALCARGGFTTGALQGWLRGAFPSPKYQLKLVTATGIDLDTLRLLVWESERLAQEVGPPQSFRRPKKAAHGGPAAPSPLPAGPHSVAGRQRPPAVGRRRPSKRTLGMLAGLALLLGGGPANAQIPYQVLEPNYAKNKPPMGLLSSRRRVA